jgi:hypothetical protein
MMSGLKRNVVLVQLNEDGSTTYLVHGQDVDVLVVDELAADDRIYKIGRRVSMETVQQVIGDSPIGHPNDGRLSDIDVEAIRRQLEADRNGGRPKLEVVS